MECAGYGEACRMNLLGRNPNSRAFKNKGLHFSNNQALLGTCYKSKIARYSTRHPVKCEFQMKKKFSISFINNKVQIQIINIQTFINLYKLFINFHKSHAIFEISLHLKLCIIFRTNFKHNVSKKEYDVLIKINKLYDA